MNNKTFRFVNSFAHKQEKTFLYNFIYFRLAIIRFSFICCLAVHLTVI